MFIPPPQIEKGFFHPSGNSLLWREYGYFLELHIMLNKASTEILEKYPSSKWYLHP